MHFTAQARRSASHEPIRFIDLVESLWPSAYSKWEELAVELQAGTLKIRKAEEVFLPLGQKLSDELALLTGQRGADWVAPCLKQLTLLETLRDAGEAAKVVLYMQAGLGLTGDFAAVQEVHAMWSTDLGGRPLKELTPQITKAATALENPHTIPHPRKWNSRGLECWGPGYMDAGVFGCWCIWLCGMICKIPIERNKGAAAPRLRWLL